MSPFSRSVLAVHAHPDDTEAFNAGLLKLLKDRGYRITIATMTGGGMGGMGEGEQATVARRIGEAGRAAAVLDAEYVCLGARDGFVMDSPELRLQVISLIRRVRAGIVITHLPMDYHSDHRATSVITEGATMISTLPNIPVEEEPVPVTPLLYYSAPLGFSTPLGTPLPPPLFALDVTGAMETKMQMLSCHESQIELMRLMHKMDDFFGEMKKYNQDLGRMAGCPFAEVYWQHLGGGYQKDPLIQEELKDLLRPFSLS